MTCCNAPSARPVQPRGKNTNQQATTDEKQLVKNNDILRNQQLGQEQDKLLENQIQAYNDNYGTKSTTTNATGAITTSINKSLLASVTTSATSNQTSVSRLLEEDESITASTSALLQKSRIAASNEEQEYTKYTEMNFDDKSELTPPSSIDINEFQEASSGRAHRNREVEEDEDEQEEAEVGEEETKRVTSGEFFTQPTGYEQNFSAIYRFNDNGLPTARDQPPWDEATRVESGRLPSSKIGHYARLEYSPIEDFDSITSKSVSRPNSERYAASSGAFRRRSMTGISNNEEPLSGTQSQRDGFSANVSRRSSRRSSGAGIESTSISISSQLSNEQLQQNLTNMLESATNSPTALFGTIGLPLGPPLEKEMETTETRKTSPETTGAALTSNSQDSLSGTSRDDYRPDGAQRSGAGTANSEGGGALIGGSDSLERDYTNSLDLSKRYSSISKVTTSTNNTFGSNTATAGGDGTESRVESALSMATTTSGQLTNPTPTPSELSGGGGGGGDANNKKKSKLRPKNLLKRFKTGKKKSKTEESASK